MLGGRNPIRPQGSFRCSNCSLNYPGPGKCKVCDAQLAWMTNQPPDPDIEDAVARLLAAEADWSDPALGWRKQQLVFAGCPMRLAEKIAADRSIDLHRALTVVSGAPHLVEAILL